MLQDAFFGGWAELVRVAVAGGAAYTALVIMLRVSGKRTLSKLNAFDLIVTVALGSTLATVVTSSDVSLAKGLTALGLLIGLQFAVSWTALRWDGFNRILKSEPSLLLRHGEPIRTALRRQRVREDELLAAIRDRGGTALADAELVILESDGSLTAILRRQAGP